MYIHCKECVDKEIHGRRPNVYYTLVFPLFPPDLKR